MKTKCKFCVTQIAPFLRDHSGGFQEGGVISLYISLLDSEPQDKTPLVSWRHPPNAIQDEWLVYSIHFG